LRSATPPQVSAGGKKTAADLPRADFHTVCPFSVAAPAVVAVLDARRGRNMLAASAHGAAPVRSKRHQLQARVDRRRGPALHRDADHHAALYPKRPERFDAKTGTLTLWFDVRMEPVKPGEAATTVVGEPCLVTWVAAHPDLEQIIARTSDGRYIAGTRVAEKSKKKK